MGSPREILVLVEEQTRPESLVRPSVGTGPRVRVRRWERVTGEDLARRGLEAVVFEPAEGARSRRKREALLRRLPEGVARVSLAPRGSQAPSPRDHREADLHLAAPVDLKVLTALLSMERRCRDLEESFRRSRRVAGQLSRHLKTLGDMTRAINAEFEPKKIMEIALQRIDSCRG